jgi:hypothetical protein
MSVTATSNSKRRARQLAAGALLAATFRTASVRADALRLRADAFSQTSSPVGLLVLRGEDRTRPWLDAEAVAWMGIRDTPDVTGDALTVTLRVRDPSGRGEVRAGRFVFSAGAIRPLHVDGVRVLGRAPVTGTSLELFAGSPVVPRFAARPYDLALGGRLAENVSDFLTVGAAYVVRRRDRDLVDQEVGPDFALSPTPWCDIAGRTAFDLVNRGPTDALGSIGLRATDFRLELFATHRSPARLLPATSLFSVLGDIPSTTTGASTRYRIAPRLELTATLSAIATGGDLGAYGVGRAVLALDDDFRGSLGLELRRQSVDAARWSGARTIVVLPLGPSLRVSTELELVRPDVPPGKNRVWPWALVAIAHRFTSGWETALAVEALGTRDDRREVHAMARLSYFYEKVR